ncbi:MAG TPA: hypothetical protein EYH30_01705 [Anaerolineales bacterium]|nr:hypothetical protein [Anaerolineales bacterium]
MAEAAFAVDRVRVEASGLLPRRHRLLAGETFLGEMAFGLGSSVSYIDAEGREMWMGRASLLPAAYRMWEGEQERASARVSLLGWQARVAFDGQTFLFRPIHLWQTVWELRDASDQLVLTVRRTGWGRAEIAVHGPVDADLLAFAYYLFIIRRRAARRRH